MARKKEIDKQRKKELKKSRSGLTLAYDPIKTEHYRPHAILQFPDLNEDTPLSAIARR